MTTIDPNVLPVEKDVPNDPTPNEEGQTEESVLVLPIVPSQDDISALSMDGTDIETPIVNADNPGLDPEAPYGRNKDGTPAKKRGRKGSPQAQGDLYDRLDSVGQARPLPSAKSAEKATGQSSYSSPVAPVIAADYREMGMLAATLWIKGGSMIFGPDWAPDMDDEQEKQQPKELAQAFTTYFKAKEIRALSPEWALVFILGTYTISKVQKPTVATRFGKVTAWLKNKLPFGNKNR